MSRILLWRMSNWLSPGRCVERSSRSGASSSALTTSVALGTLLLALGCHEPFNRTQAKQAEDNWARLRAQFKLGLARQQFEEGHIGDAITTLQEAIGMNPEDSIYHRLLAKCHLERASVSSARSAAEEAIRLGDSSADLSYTLGLIAERRSKGEQAFRHFERAVRTQPGSADYLAAAAESLVALGRVQEARAFLDEQPWNEEGNERLLVLRARIYLLLGAPAKAAKDFEAAEHCLVDDPWAAEEFGLVLVRLNRFGKAMSVLLPLMEVQAAGPESALGRRERSPAVLRALAICHNNLGAPDRAKSLLQEHLQSEPDDGRAWWILAESLIRIGDWGGVRRCIDRGELAAPQVLDWKLLRAYMAWNCGDLDTTAMCLESIVAERPEDAMAHCFLGQVYERSSDFQRARDHYELAHQADPDFEWAYDGLCGLPDNH